MPVSEFIELRITLSEMIEESQRRDKGGAAPQIDLSGAGKME